MVNGHEYLICQGDVKHFREIMAKFSENFYHKEKESRTISTIDPKTGKRMGFPNSKI